ncbi:MAG: methyltransferase domain-containing protein [Nanoarchaeota archaeon]|nr:methyltransferase domain-containing protein [Nanoarchaeota archaeon]
MEKKELKLNLGCGYDIRKGWINIDQFRGEGIDMCTDLNKAPYPFKGNSVDRIYVRLLLEHLTLPYHKFFKEILRILKPGGVIVLVVPHFTGRYAQSEVTKLFNYFSFRPCGDRECDIFNDFQEISRHLSFERDWYLPLNPLIEKLANKYPFVYENTMLKALFPAFELKIVFKKK